MELLGNKTSLNQRITILFLVVFPMTNSQFNLNFQATKTILGIKNSGTKGKEDKNNALTELKAWVLILV